MNRAVLDTYASTPPRSTIEAGRAAWRAGDVEGSSIDHVWSNTRVFLSGDRVAMANAVQLGADHKEVRNPDWILSVGLEPLGEVVSTRWNTSR